MVGRFLRARPLIGGILGLVFLWLLFLPAADPESHRFLLDPRPQAIELLLLAALGALALAGRPLPAAARRLVATVVLLLAVLQLVDALVESALDRGLEIYFDAEHVPALLGLAAEAAGPWRFALALAAALAAVLATLALALWALGAVARALAPRRCAKGALAFAALALALAAVPVDEDRTLVRGGALATALRQAASAGEAWAALHGFDRRRAAALAAPQPALGPLPGLKGRDVLLVFFESYGTTVLDEPRFRGQLQPALDRFAATVAGAGYGLVSSRFVSPTFGGGSWLAHGTVASGVKLDPILSRLILDSDRRTLARYMAAAGYRTVDVMPGIKKPWPDGGFWGFERSYYAADLGYDGPPFGWFDIPDQYTLRRFAELELGPGHAPLFAELVLVSSHTPFAPVPPYVADWRDAGPYKSVDEAEWDRVYRQPDWTNLEAPYVASVRYDLEVLGAWLARLEGDALVVIMGDHQPPGFAADAAQPWTVPVHVLSRDRALLEPFAALGFAPGAVPPPEPASRGMERFLADFVAAYARSPAVLAGGGQREPRN